ncbi:MAG: TonB-dependent receptor plug domain-containing protein, partial [Opitutaceae bacterium]
MSGSFAFGQATPNKQAPVIGKSAGSGPEETLQLNPFEVQADKDDSYGALNSNSITRFKTDLDKMPISADIYDQTFMRDVAAQTVEAMIQTYSSGSGYSGADAGAAAASSTPGDRYGSGYMTLRGFQTPAILRDAFMPAGSVNTTGGTGTGVTSNFDLERVEIIQGPQALLYGQGGAGGVINIVSKQARFGSSMSGGLTFSVDQHGSKNAMMDFGFGNNHVALRVALINNTLASRRVGIGGTLQGYYTQLAVRLYNTTVRFNVEQTDYKRVFNSKTTLTALSTANDARNGQMLTYILATNQVNAAANGGASGAGPIANGNLNWSNVNS